MNKSEGRDSIERILFLACSSAALGVLLAVQHPEFRRIDFNLILSIFVMTLAWRMRSNYGVLRWLCGFFATYFFCIAEYLAILAFNRFVFAYNPIGGFHDWIDLAFLVPYFSMAPLFFVIQSAFNALRKA